MSGCTRCWAPPPGGSPSCTPGPAGGRRSRCAVSARRVYLAVGAAAAVVHLGVLWNGFALDDLTIIVANPLVHGLSRVLRGCARALLSAYPRPPAYVPPCP